ncbi:MAG: hypothetical protein ABSA41_11155 [Terriglobia bacterium]
MKSPDKLYRFHVENLRAVQVGLDKVLAAGRRSIALRQASAVPTYLRLYAFMVGAWAECRLLKLLYEPAAFSDAERQTIRDETALVRWVKVVETAFRRHYLIPAATLQPPALPKTAHVRLQVLTSVIQDDLRWIITLRNKLAHGQWAYPLTDDLEDIAQEQMDALRTENLLSLKQKASLIEWLCASIHDLVVSLPTFNRDFDRHFARIEQTRRNLATKDYARWVSQIKTKHDRGQADFRQRIKASG